MTCDTVEGEQLEKPSETARDGSIGKSAGIPFNIARLPLFHQRELLQRAPLRCLRLRAVPAPPPPERARNARARPPDGARDLARLSRVRADPEIGREVESARARAEEEEEEEERIDVRQPSKLASGFPANNGSAAICGCRSPGVANKTATEFTIPRKRKSDDVDADAAVDSDVNSIARSSMDAHAN